MVTCCDQMWIFKRKFGRPDENVMEGARIMEGAAGRFLQDPGEILVVLPEGWRVGTGRDWDGSGPWPPTLLAMELTTRF